jgi:ABC-2 type transport system ATP-binding protein
MCEGALTAERLIVVGRGRLIADTSVAEFIARASGNVVRVRAPQAAQLRGLLLGPDVSVASSEAQLLEVQGLTAKQIGTVAWENHIELSELTSQQASLEEAFMELTQDAVEFCSPDAAGRLSHAGAVR